MARAPVFVPVYRVATLGPAPHSPQQGTGPGHTIRDGRFVIRGAGTETSTEGPGVEEGGQ